MPIIFLFCLFSDLWKQDKNQQIKNQGKSDNEFPKCFNQDPLHYPIFNLFFGKNDQVLCTKIFSLYYFIFIYCILRYLYFKFLLIYFGK